MKTTIVKTYAGRLTTKRKLSAAQFLKEQQAGSVTKGRFVPPQIGSAGFGHFEVDLVKPRYEVVLD
ncbi:hypothetical protein HOP60_09920 [Halomonas daqingensis]|uniref:Uncharacterized protein n=1 Tax=Billgrantia desiderata TaxID=52021 RepID=A0ABS9B508_9GAMM|nr:hypothetical protein [Halomonas desiderata]MCE8042470.1 hypothetical protein [Halomonas desiderata]MCE8047045.1 hypothetical protein [Halomonas desiderata]